MADISATPLANYDQMMGIVPENASQVQGDYALGGLQRAQTGLVGQQTIGAGLQNQKTQMLLAQLQKLNSNPQPVNPYPNGGVSSGEHDELLADGNIDAGAIATHAAQKYSGGLDIWSPQELQQLQSAPLWAGLGVPGMEQMVKARHDAELQTRRQMVQLQAGNDFENNMNVANAPPGAAYQMMARTDPQKARWIDQQAEANGWDDNKKDQIVRALESESANQAFVYSGREAEMGKDGIVRDKKTGKPIPNALPEGTSKEQATQLWDEANKVQTIVVNGRETPVKTYKLAGFNSPQEYVAAEAKSFMNQQRQTQQGGTSPPAGSTASPTPNTGNPTAGGPQVTGTQSTSTQPTFLGSHTTAPPTATTPPNMASAPQPDVTATSPLGAAQQAFIRNASGPPSFINTGGGKATPGEAAGQTDYYKDRANLLKQSTALQQESNMTLASVNRVQSALDKTPKLGPGSEEYSKVQTVVANWAPRWIAQIMSPNGENQAAARQLLQKYISTDQLNTILKQFHQEGAQVRLGAYETRAIMNYMSANPELARPAIQQMLTWEKADAQYNMTKAKTGIAYVNANRDPQQFNYEGAFARPGVEKPSSTSRIAVTNKESYEALQDGDNYILPDGRIGIKGKK